MRGGDVVDLDDQRRDRVGLGLRREQHRVRLQVGVDLGRLRDDLDQALVGRARVAGQRALPDGVAGRVAGLVQVGREQVEVLVALGEVEARVAHVRALLGGDDVERLLGQAAAEVDRHPLHARVAADLDAPRREVVDLAAAPVLVVGEVHLRARRGVQLERAGVQRLALEVGREEVLADGALGVLADDGERVRVLRGAGLVDQVDDLDRLLDPDVLRARGRTRRRSRTRRSRPRTCPRRRGGAWRSTPRRGRGAPRRPARASITMMRSSATSAYTTLAPRWTISAGVLLVAEVRRGRSPAARSSGS